jgi:cation transport ATPase
MTDMKKADLRVTGMICASCTAAIEKSLQDENIKTSNENPFGYTCKSMAGRSDCFPKKN